MNKKRSYDILSNNFPCLRSYTSKQLLIAMTNGKEIITPNIPNKVPPAKITNNDNNGPTALLFLWTIGEITYPSKLDKMKNAIIIPNYLKEKSLAFSKEAKLLLEEKFNFSKLR